MDTKIYSLVKDSKILVLDISNLSISKLELFQKIPRRILHVSTVKKGHKNGRKKIQNITCKYSGKSPLKSIDKVKCIETKS